MVLRDSVFERLQQIPAGEVVTYKELAQKFNTSPRAIARILSTNSLPIIIPCHRVVCSDRRVGGYTYRGKQDVAKKIALLRAEGVCILEEKVIKQS